MKKETYKTYTHPAKCLTAVFNTPLNCWVFMKHRKNGKVRARTLPVHGFDPQFTKAVTLARASHNSNLSFKPPASGWVRSLLIIKGATLWSQLHEATFKNQAAGYLPGLVIELKQ
jgi:hypothetical protein